MTFRRISCALIALVTLVVASLAAQPAEKATDGEGIYKAQCATCHDKPDTRAPDRETLKAKPASAVLASLVSGSMSVNARDLTMEQKRAVAAFVGVAPEVSGNPDTAMCRTTPAFDPFTGPRWMGWGVDRANTRFQPAAQAGLTAAQVPQLKLKWAFGFPGSTLAFAQPTVAGGRVFVGSDKGIVYALDAATGCAYWSFAAPAGVRSAVAIGRVKPEGAASPRPLAFFGDLQANVHAVDAATGVSVWKVKLDDHRFARITGSPVFEGDRLYVPVSSVEEVSGARPNYQCCTFRGSIVALDAASGKVIWKTYTIADEPKPLRMNSAGVQQWGPAGAAVWNAPTIDTRRGLLYIGTGNAYTAPAAATSDAIMAIEMQTGKVRWTRQVTPNDTFVIGCGNNNPNCPDSGPDHDFGTSPILRTVNGRDLLFVGQKSGVAYALDPEKNGEIVWEYRVGKGSALGGIEWGMAADEQLLFVPNSDVISGTGLVGGTPPADAGGLFGLRLANGEKVWQAPAVKPTCTEPRGCSGAQSAAVSAMPGIVFSGAIDGHLRAYSTRDGSIVWDFDTNREFETVNHVKASGGSIDAAGPSIAGGMVFTNSGYGQFRGKPGNVLLAFGVDK